MPPADGRRYPITFFDVRDQAAKHALVIRTAPCECVAEPASGRVEIDPPACFGKRLTYRAFCSFREMLQRRCALRTGARFASTVSSRSQPESRENSVLDERFGRRRAPVVGCRRPGCATEIRLNFVAGA